KFRIETIGLRAPVFARHRDAGRMDDIGLNIARPQPAREPEPVAASLKGDDNTLDVAPSLAGFAAPTMQEFQQRFLLGIELLKGWRSTPGTSAATSHFVRLISITAMIVLSCSRAVRDLLASERECCDIGGAPSVAVEQRPWCHAFA